MTIDFFMKKNREVFSEISKKMNISVKEKAEIFGRLFRACQGRETAVLISSILYVWGVGTDNNSRNEIFVRSSLLPDYLED